MHLFNMFRYQLIMWVFTLFINFVSSQQPLPPLWPTTFTQSFNETFVTTNFGNQTTTGIYYYDWTTQSTRLDRANGRFDEFCGQIGFKILENSSCIQYVVNSNRFVYFGNDDYCCFCCNAAQGCGSLFPT